MKPNIGINDEQRIAVAEVLKVLLANEYVLSVKTKGAHWNVVGIDFADKHELFESQYVQLNEVIDDVAERIRQLGFTPPASMEEFLALTTLNETKAAKFKSPIFIEELLNDHEAIIRFLRINIELAEKNNDDGTADFIIALIQIHEKISWFLRSHLE